ncbi:hypothetical protein [Clostridium cuniculi]|uniref:hypothetical protein n=1 Tax=Clostridium cuniculi TaxID=2548455 RepID=UPI00140FA121|nr:hypothetical protein [Clostridium cuniculi]
MIKQTKVRTFSAESITKLENKLNEFCKDKEIKTIQYQIDNNLCLYKHIAMVVYEIITH